MTACGVSRRRARPMCSAGASSCKASRQTANVFPVEISIHRVDLPGEVSFAAYLRDLSAIKDADQQITEQRERIHQSEKLSAMGSLLAGVAHELNNPLAVVVAHASLLEAKATGGVKQRAQKIHSAAERLRAHRQELSRPGAAEAGDARSDRPEPARRRRRRHARLRPEKLRCGGDPRLRDRPSGHRGGQGPVQPGDRQSHRQRPAGACRQAAAAHDLGQDLFEFRRRHAGSRGQRAGGRG